MSIPAQKKLDLPVAMVIISYSGCVLNRWGQLLGLDNERLEDPLLGDWWETPRWKTPKRAEASTHQTWFTLPAVYPPRVGPYQSLPGGDWPRRRPADFCKFVGD